MPDPGRPDVARAGRRRVSGPPPRKRSAPPPSEPAASDAPSDRHLRRRAAPAPLSYCQPGKRRRLKTQLMKRSRQRIQLSKSRG